MSNFNLPPGVSEFDNHINPPVLKRVKRIRSHTGHARFLAECSEQPIGWIDQQEDIPSPYAYSQEWPIYSHSKYGYVLIRETSHRCFDVFKVPQSFLI